MEKHIIARTVVIDPEGDVLLLRRSLTDDHRAGGFDIPGGRGEPGESDEEAAVRELYEETRISTSVDKLELVHQLVKTGREPNVEIVSLFYMLHLLERPDVVISDEHDKACWLTIDEAIVVCLSVASRMQRSQSLEAALVHIRDNQLHIKPKFCE